jgi:cytochrome d ubiquinol oxidase subunit I
VLKTEHGVSPEAAVSAGEVLLTLAGFTIVYAVLMAVDIYLLKKYAVAGTSKTNHEA